MRRSTVLLLIVTRTSATPAPCATWLWRSSRTLLACWRCAYSSQGRMTGASMPLDNEGQNHIPEAVRRQGRRAEERAREIGSIVDPPSTEEPVVEAPAV